MANFSKKISLCADDYGLNPSISVGILKLVRQGRLSAVSCMVNGASFADDAKALAALKDQVQIGLHLNFTDGFFLSAPERAFFELNELLIKSHLALVPTSFIRKEMQAQLDRFSDLMGFFPQFIDGHQHVHQFPKFRKVLLEIYETDLRESSVAVRSVYPAVSLDNYRWKTFILAVTGGFVLSRQLKKLKIPHNTCFAGIYDFKPDANYRALFNQWLQKVPSGGLIMCHPGVPSDEDEPLAKARTVELRYFLSEEFLLDCKEAGVSLVSPCKEFI